MRKLNTFFIALSVYHALLSIQVNKLSVYAFLCKNGFCLLVIDIQRVMCLAACFCCFSARIHACHEPSMHVY